MFGWLFGRRQHVFHPKERLIYRYWDGARMVAQDPLVLYRRFATVQPQLVIDRKVATSLSKDANKAWPKMIAHIHGIFGVKSMEEGGLTEAEAVQLLDDFLTFCETIKKKESPIPTSPTTTLPPTPLSSDEGPPTPSGSDSGSVANEPSTDAPTPSPTERPSE